MNTSFNDETDPVRTRDWHEEDSPWKAKQIYQILKQNNIEPGSVCEIGCGAGGVIANLADYYDKNVNFYGYETSDEGFEIARRKEQENIQYFKKDLLKEDAYYDVVMAINVFTHVWDHLGFLSKLRNKGEYKVFHIPLSVTVYSVLRSRYLQNKDVMRSHLHHFNKDTALGTLQGTGYQIIDYFYTADAIELPNLGRKANLWRLPRKLLYAIDKDFAAKLLGGFSLLVLAK